MDLLRRLAPILAKHNISGNAAADIIAAVYRECDVDLEEVIVSPATAKRSKVEETIMLKDKVVNEFKQKVLDNNNIKLTLHYDTKLMKQRMERLALVVSAPELQRPQLLAVLGLQGGTALEQATAACDVLLESGLEKQVVDLFYDTTAVNTGRLGDTVRLLQNMAATTMITSPCRRCLSIH